MRMILGIDTSCYTTSTALISESGEILRDNRILLQVKPGARGLQQSAAVFQHLQNIPRALNHSLTAPLCAVVAAVKPRPAPGSYLPVFQVGASFGEAIANLMKIPFLATSHQEGHIRAGLLGNEALAPDEPFLAWHLSGGTTELLLIRPVFGLNMDQTGFQIQIIGGSSDLQVGQFIDRVGVNMGLSFPAGPALEKLALESTSEAALPITNHGLTLSFSGPAAAAERAIESGGPIPNLARRVFNCVSKGILEVSRLAVQQCHIHRILMVGGVSSSRIIRDTLTAKGEKLGIQFEFGLKELSSDNAVGAGLIGYDYLSKGSDTDAQKISDY